ncbi:CPBP family intramembrane glutamic endopeptidase [Pseudodesulfovibrio piezophilus]|uniref:Abortive infection protein n=1 Tax=Pseudodesulfovibrio piezophilus (strain DSM 21447 / JCM 15486 / C1TLV30) TaxID=1322246 RepID=M1WYF8_PSEP2|nr:CPBP family intramembrane glutamic endopeptidase [Pseudodesulfovibrio piezophilus]CCH50323.1 Abortive infection protein [Pseudodesulfovibrio piezophilus C1TLV30]
MCTALKKNSQLVPIIWFLALTFGMTYAVEISLICNGVRFDNDFIQLSPTIALLAVMWIPGVSALFVTTVIEHTPLGSIAEALWLKVTSIAPYVVTLFLIPVVFAAMYGLSWALGLTAPDISMSGLTEATGSSESITVSTLFEVMLPMSIIIGPFINFTFGLGEEIGWRGFLLPRLMGLGRIKAHFCLGIIWGLWHAPLIWAGFNYPGFPVTGIFLMCLLCIAFGLFLNEMTLHYKSTLLAAFIHAAANAQGYGIWGWLFPDTSPLLGGGSGLTGVLIWSITGLMTFFFLSRFSSPKA